MAAAVVGDDRTALLPVWCTEWDLALSALPDLAAPDSRFGRVRYLVRLHGEPLGYVEVPLVLGRADAEEVVRAVDERLRAKVVEHLVAEGFAADAYADRGAWSTPRDSCPNLVRADLSVSVVVCTRNRAEQLRACLAGLQRLTHPAVEVVVVDNAPVDDTTLRAFAEQVGSDPRFRYVTEPRPGLSCARNRGLAEAVHDVVAYTDDDVRVDPGWVEGLLRGFAEGTDVACVTGLVCAASLDGPAELYFDGRLDWAESCDRRRFDMSPQLQDGLYPYSPGLFGTGANFAVRRDVLVGLGGFDEALGAGTRTAGGEDLDLFVQVLLTGHALVYQPAAIVWHHHRADLEGLRRQMFGYGTGFTAFLTKHLLDRRTRLPLLRRVPRGVRKMVAVPSATSESFQAGDVPARSLMLTELRGYVVGPLRYLQARATAGPAGAGRFPVLARVDEVAGAAAADTETGAGEQAPAVHPSLTLAFRALDAATPAWALLRGEDELARPEGDVDLVVDPAAARTLPRVLAGAGFRHLPAGGRGSHTFYFRYEPSEDLWLKLDLVSRLAFGEYQELATPWAARVLRGRVRTGALNQLAPGDTAWLLLLHLFLDKGAIAPGRRGEATEAAAAAPTTGAVPAFLAQITGRRDVAHRLVELVLAGDFDAADALGAEVRRSWSERRRLRVAATRFVGRVARHSSGLTLGTRGPGRVVAILGPDGAGKTTLANSLCRDLPTGGRYVYMGLWRETRWDPVLARIPGARLGLLLGRAARASLLVRYHRARGRVVVVDRFSYDIFASSDPSLGGRLLAAFVLRAAPSPDELVLLDAPGEVMFARKQEHSAEVLETRRQAYLDLGSRFPHMVVVDATQSADVVRRTTLDALWNQRAAASASPAVDD